MKTLIYLIIFLVGLFAKAQQGELINNTWYLQKLVVNDGEYYRPSNSESNSSISRIEFSTDHFVVYGICNYIDLSGNDYTYDNTSIFGINGGCGGSLAMCTIEENTNFETLHFNTYCNYPISNSNFSPYSYEIIYQDTYKQLIITNPQGNQAYYNSVYLSAEDIDSESSQVRIHLNPVGGPLFIEVQYSFDHLIIDIFTLTGQEVLQKKVFSRTTEIDLSSLEKGIYLLNILNEKGDIIKTEKIIKE